jgi:anti-sigma-K factor RskA
MIDDNRQDLAAEYALDALDPESTRAFEALLAKDAELKALADQLRETAAQLVHDAPQELPPPDLRERVLAKIRAEAQAAAAPPAVLPATPSQLTPTPPSSSGGLGFLPWALAAGFAITTGALWTERSQLRNETEQLKSEAIALRERVELSKVKIASLSSQVDAYARASAVVVWDSEHQRGVLKLANVPPPEAGKDYQLWVIAPKKPPVSGGIVHVGPGGGADVDFAPVKPVRADQFAISIEPTGGGEQPTGPVVLAGK